MGREATERSTNGRQAPRNRRCRWARVGMAGTAEGAIAMRWSELETRQSRLAELGRRRLLAPGVVLVATIRRDGTPRVSPVEPYLMHGDLWLSMLWQST